MFEKIIESDALFGVPALNTVVRYHMFGVPALNTVVRYHMNRCSLGFGKLFIPIPD
jgi:hypothetical protein